MVRSYFVFLIVIAPLLVPAASSAWAGGGLPDSPGGQHGWNETIRDLENEALASPLDGAAQLRLAKALAQAGQLGEANSHLDRALTLGAPAGLVAFARAQNLALAADRDAAFQQLDLAVELGVAPVLQPLSDPFLASLRADARFAVFLDKFNRAVAPCRYDAHYREFDFWLGAWDVRRNGSSEHAPPSENIITQEHEGCVVQEHWRSNAGGTGSSFNIYDTTRKRWFQTWVDSDGELHEYRGNPDEHGNMIFSGETPGGPGRPARVQTRLSFLRLDSDHVRQLSESTIDGAKTWTVNYDLIYTRRGGAALK